MPRKPTVGQVSAYVALAIVMLGSLAFVVGLVIGKSQLAVTGFFTAALAAGAMGVWFFWLVEEPSVPEGVAYHGCPTYAGLIGGIPIH